MKGQVIGKTMPFGFAGSYSRQPDMVVDSHPLSGSTDVIFGQALVYGPNGEVVLVSDTTTAEQFVGVAAREIKGATNYLDQGTGAYHPGEMVSVFKRGRINVLCQNGAPAFGGDVYVRVKTNESYPNASVGGFEAVADSTNSVKLTNAKWRGSADANGVAELSILTMINV